jgi:hypothetical protein
MKTLVPIELIASKIYLIRGIKVMLDRDLAELYDVETRVLNQAVSRNLERFPEDFMFSLTREEIMRISQIVTSSEIKFSKSVRCFTEQGVAMLSSVLRSKRAIQAESLRQESDKINTPPEGHMFYLFWPPCPVECGAYSSGVNGKQ